MLTKQGYDRENSLRLMFRILFGRLLCFINWHIEKWKRLPLICH